VGAEVGYAPLYVGVKGKLLNATGAKVAPNDAKKNTDWSLRSAGIPAIRFSFRRESGHGFTPAFMSASAQIW
jgi:hypothetical protein